MFGGAAGPGKSVGLLASALQWIEEPGYHALILRRTFKMLAMADSILAKAKDWLWNKTDANGVKVKYNGDDHKFTFPNGNTLQFGHMEHEDSVRNYIGGIWAFIGVDEASQFTERMLTMPRTRQRRPAGSRMPMRWRAATNPGDVGHEYLKRRYIKDLNGKAIQNPDRQFFPARIEDNPNLDREDYIKQLKESGIDGVLLDQLLSGDWDAVPGGRFRREWFGSYDWNGEYIRLRNPDGTRHGEPFLPKGYYRFITCDPAASSSTKADWTVISTWCVGPVNELIWLACDRCQVEVTDIVPRIQKAFLRWHPAIVGIEAIAANNAVYKHASIARNPAVPAHALNKGNRDKLVHATAAIVLASTKRVYLPAEDVDASFPLEDVLSELVRFTGNEKQDSHDDAVDTLSYAAELMTGMPTGDQRRSFPKVIGG